jgi:hypothetical protein
MTSHAKALQEIWELEGTHIISMNIPKGGLLCLHLKKWRKFMPIFVGVKRTTPLLFVFMLPMSRFIQPLPHVLPWVKPSGYGHCQNVRLDLALGPLFGECPHPRPLSSAKKSLHFFNQTRITYQ